MLVSQHQVVVNEISSVCFTTVFYISQLRLVRLLNTAYKVYYNTVHKVCTFVQLIFGRPVVNHFPDGGDTSVHCFRGSSLSKV
jgi:hypothetical protein